MGFLIRLFLTGTVSFIAMMSGMGSGNIIPGAVIAFGAWGLFIFGGLLQRTTRNGNSASGNSFWRNTLDGSCENEPDVIKPENPIFPL